MAWTSPMTATVGAVFTAAQWNTHARDNLLFLFGGRVVVTADVDVVNTTTETDLISQSIAANAMGTDGVLVVLLAGDYKNDSGSQPNQDVRIKFGGTTFWHGTVAAAALQVARRAWSIRFEIANKGATNAQFMEGELTIGDNAPTTGLGNPGSSGAPARFAEIATDGDKAIDTTSSQTLAVSVQHASANANLSWRLKYARIQVT